MQAFTLQPKPVTMIDYFLAATDEDYEEAKVLFKEYAGAINIDLSFQHFDEELSEIKKMYSHAEGGIILAKNENEFTGCVAIRKFDKTVGELKRMFVKPRYQNFGIGKILLEHAIALAKKCNYKLIRLDTLNYMTPAIHLYKQYGFYEIESYYHNPINTAVYFEKKLN